MKKKAALLAADECTLYLLRHGAIATPGILAGKTNVALSTLGREQLMQATTPLKNIERCISSPLIRCQEWAKLYCQQQALPLEIDSKIQEMDFGDWDGRPYQELWEINTHSASITIGDFWQNPWQHQPPNGESMDNFVCRVDDWWQGFCAQSNLVDTLVFSHAGVIKHLLARILQLPIPGTAHMASIEIPYGCIIKISLYRDESGKVWSKLVL